MAKEIHDVTETELALLQVLWERGRCSTRQIADVHYPGGGTSHYATVQKLLERLEAKGLVRRDRSLFVHTFVAAIDRDELIGRRLRGLADALCGGSLVPILSHLARPDALTDAERQALRDLIDEPAPSEPSPRRSKRRKG